MENGRALEGFEGAQFRRSVRCSRAPIDYNILTRGLHRTQRAIVGDIELNVNTAVAVAVNLRASKCWHRGPAPSSRPLYLRLSRLGAWRPPYAHPRNILTLSRGDVGSLSLHTRVVRLRVKWPRAWELEAGP